MKDCNLEKKGAEVMMKIRKTTRTDLPELMDLFAEARVFMAEMGNATQWVDGYPSRAQIEEDMERGYSYVCEAQGEILGTFYFPPGPDPTYIRIDGGAWLNDAPYHVIHRIATKGGTTGVASFCLEYCKSLDAHIRIDTHRNNVPMQNFLKKHGFVYCGIIYLENGDERLAYQLISTTTISGTLRKR